MNAIYKLTKDDVIRYLGQTSETPRRRLQKHMTEARGGKVNHRLNWLRSLDRLPEIEVIEWVLPSDVENREKYWIAVAREYGCNLVNDTDGGEGAINPSPETREKRRQKMLGDKNPNFGKPLPEWQRKAVRDAKLGKPLRTETKEKMRRVLRSTNTSGVPGVSCIKTTGKWRASLMLDGRRETLGNFSTIEEAASARKNALEQIHI